MMSFNDFAKRIYWDYFSPNRLNFLEIIYTKALCSGYNIVNCIDFWNILKVVSPVTKQFFAAFVGVNVGV